MILTAYLDSNVELQNLQEQENISIISITPIKFNKLRDLDSSRTVYVYRLFVVYRTFGDSSSIPDESLPDLSEVPVSVLNRRIQEAVNRDDPPRPSDEEMKSILKKGKFRIFDWMDGSFNDYDNFDEAKSRFDELQKEADDGTEIDVSFYQVFGERNTLSK